MKNKLPLRKVKSDIDKMLEEAIKKRGLTEKDSKKLFNDPKKKDKK